MTFVRRPNMNRRGVGSQAGASGEAPSDDREATIAGTSSVQTGAATVTAYDAIFNETNGTAEYDFARSVVGTTDASISDGSAFDQASWTKTQVTITANADGVADRVTVDAAATTPTVSQSVTNPGVNATQNPPMVFVVDVQSADVTWILIETRAATAANRTWFRIDGTPSVGTNGANHSGATNTDASGYRRLTLTMNANAGTAIFAIRPVNADNSLTTSGDGTSFLAKTASVTQRRVSSITNRKTGDASMAMGTGGIQLGYDATGFNGGPCCTCWGAQYLLSTEAAVVAAVAGTDVALTVFAVVQCVSMDSLQTFFGAGNSGTATNSTRMFGTVTTNTGRVRASHLDDAAGNAGVEAVNATTNPTDPHIFEFYTTGTAMSIQADGAAADPSAGAADVGATTPNRVSIASRPDSTPDSMGGSSPSFGTKIALISLFAANKDASSRSRIRVNYGARKTITVTP